MNRRGFLKRLGVGGAAIVAAPLIKELTVQENVKAAPEKVASNTSMGNTGKVVRGELSKSLWPGIKDWYETQYKEMEYKYGVY